MDIPVPLINSLTNWFDFNKANIDPSINNLLKISEEWSFSIAKGRSNIIANIIWTSRREGKLLSHALKIPLVLLFSKHKKAKGESITKTFVKIYLNAKVITNVKDETEIMVVRIPSKEKTSKVPLSSDNLSIRAEKEIFWFSFSFPILHITLVISWVVESAPRANS